MSHHLLWTAFGNINLPFLSNRVILSWALLGSSKILLWHGIFNTLRFISQSTKPCTFDTCQRYVVLFVSPVSSIGGRPTSRTWSTAGGEPGARPGHRRSTHILHGVCGPVYSLFPDGQHHSLLRKYGGRRCFCFRFEFLRSCLCKPSPLLGSLGRFWSDQVNLFFFAWEDKKCTVRPGLVSIWVYWYGHD